MTVINMSNNETLAVKAKFAKTFFSRLAGLLLRKNMSNGECLVIRPCSSVHTFGMSFPIDVLFITKDNVVVYAIENMLPCRVSKIVRKSAMALELPVGTIWKTNTKSGDKLSFIL